MYLDIATLVSLYVVYGGFGAMGAKLSGCNKYLLSSTTEEMFSNLCTRKKLLVLGYSNNPLKHVYLVVLIEEMFRNHILNSDTEEKQRRVFFLFSPIMPTASANFIHFILSL